MRQFTAALIICSLHAAELPVREVILFKHGVGFFSRSGDLKAGEAARLDFKATDMNDVLKSLTVEERGGGKVVALRYDSSEPLEKKLEQFSFEIGDHFALSAVLDQMKGARVELKYTADLVAGQIVSGRETGPDKDRAAREQVVLLLDSGEMRTIDLGAVTGIKFSEISVQRQFADYLRLVSQARSKDKRSVYLDSSRAGSRSLVANYMIPAAVWKCSYRLVFGGTDATLEGWAIVDNTTDEDWSSVQLALVSGRPISFISALYEPKYRERIVAQLPEDDSVTPVVYGGSFAAPKSMGVAGGVPGGTAGGVVGGIIGEVPAAAPPPPPPPRRLVVRDSTIEVETEGRERGELFEYRFQSPVTVRMGESAMLPFLQQKIATRKLLVYQEALGDRPRVAAELTNSTGKTLDGGPITVYDDGVYAGEALVETMKAGDKRLISYAVDLGTRVTTKIDTGEAMVRAVAAIHGELRARSATLSTRTYTIHSVDAKTKTLIIEHPIRPGFRLVSPKAFETTGSAYRFEVKLEGKPTQALAVKEENLYEDVHQVSYLTPDLLLAYSSQWPLSAVARRQLAAVADAKRQLAAFTDSMRSLEADTREVVRDQERLRENIRTVNLVAGQQEQVQKYARQLADGDVRLADLSQQLKNAAKRQQEWKNEVAGLIERLLF